MGLFGGDTIRGHVKEVHKWTYINLNDFRSSNCLTIFSFVWVWILAIISVAVYAADTFTAVNLLAFDKGFEQVKAWVPFDIQKWVFVGCILFSWVLCFYEWFRAWRIMKQNSVTEDYLDPLAVVLQCLRIPGGWRRFLVFAELTKSKKKAAWVAIFVYFQRKGAIRILAAEGPRNVLNAFSIYAVATSELLDVSGNTVSKNSGIGTFFKNIQSMFQTRQLEAVVLLSMTFSFLIWFISMLLLIAALIFWLCFISHHVDKETLTGYCRRKIETRLAKIVKAKTDKIWAKEEAAREKQREKDKKKGGIEVEELEIEAPFGAMKRQPTLPVFESSPPSSDYLNRMDSASTLPRYQSRPGTPDDHVPPLPRQFSAQSSLLGNAQPMGQSGPTVRPGTAASNRSYQSSRYVPTISTPANDPTFTSAARGTPLSSASSSFESQRRNSPPSGMTAPWRGSNHRNSDEQYEMVEPAGLPSVLRPAAGRREVSSPGPDRGPLPYPPTRSFTAPGGPQGIPPRMTTPGGQPLPRSMTPAINPIPRSMTPGTPPARNITPAPLRNQNSGPASFPHSRQQPSRNGPGAHGWNRSGSAGPQPGMAM